MLTAIVKSTNKPNGNPTETHLREENRIEKREGGGEYSERENLNQPIPAATLPLPCPAPLILPLAPRAIARVENAPNADAEDVLAVLHRIFPFASEALSHSESVAFHQSIPVLAELSADDWKAVEVWRNAPNPVKGRKCGASNWPRDRAEFLTHAGEATEKIRAWWADKGRAWHAKQCATKTTPRQQVIYPAAETATDDDLAAFFVATRTSLYGNR